MSFADHKLIDRSVDRHKTQLIGLICPRPESIQLVSGIHATTPPPFPDHYLPSVAERLWPCFSHIKCHGQTKKRPCGNANYHHYHLYIMHICILYVNKSGKQKRRANMTTSLICHFASARRSVQQVHYPCVEKHSLFFLLQLYANSITHGGVSVSLIRP